MNVQEIIDEVRNRVVTNYEGREPRRDEVLVAEIARLRAEIARLRTALSPPVTNTRQLCVKPLFTVCLSTYRYQPRGEDGGAR